MNEITQLLHIDPLLLQALREDIPEEDVSTNAVMPHACPGIVDLIAKRTALLPVWRSMPASLRCWTPAPRWNSSAGTAIPYSPARSWPLLRAIYAPCFPVSALR